MYLLHIALYSFSFTLGMIGGILFPELPWLSCLVAGSVTVFVLRQAKARQASRLQIVMRNNHIRHEQLMAEIHNVYNKPTSE
jgi:hypothetical protein